MTVTRVVNGNFMVYVVVGSGIRLVHVLVCKIVVFCMDGVANVGDKMVGTDPYKTDDAQLPPPLVICV